MRVHVAAVYAAPMRHAIIALVLATACGNSEEAGREAAQQRAAETTRAETPPAPPVKKGVPDVAKPTAPPPGPEPTTPAEIEHARNQAMIDGRDKDVLKYCALGKLDDKSSPQALLGCTLSACRIKDADTARQYSKALKKEYLDQAKRVCVGNSVTL